jgi:hypothetical protein
LKKNRHSFGVAVEVFRGGTIGERQEDRQKNGGKKPSSFFK